MKKLRQKWKHHLTMARKALKLVPKDGFLMAILYKHHKDTAKAIRQQIDARKRKVTA